MTDDGAQDLREENDRLRAALRVVTDDLASLLDTGKFPPRGRSRDDKDSSEGWWEDRVSHIATAYAALAGVSAEEWCATHPGLYIPPAGGIVL